MFGLVLGIIVHLTLTDIYPDITLNNYSLSDPFPGYYLALFLLFIPLLILIYFCMNRIKVKRVLQGYVLFINLTIYFVYGILVMGGQFWHLPLLFEGNFIMWLSIEHSDQYFSVSSLLVVILFTKLNMQNFKLDQDSKKY